MTFSLSATQWIQSVRFEESKFALFFLNSNIFFRIKKDIRIISQQLCIWCVQTTNVYIYIYILFILAVLKIELFPAIGPSSLLINITEGKVHRHKYKKKKELFLFQRQRLCEKNKTNKHCRENSRLICRLADRLGVNIGLLFWKDCLFSIQSNTFHLLSIKHDKCTIRWLQIEAAPIWYIPCLLSSPHSGTCSRNKPTKTSSRIVGNESRDIEREKVQSDFSALYKETKGLASKI